MHLLQLQRTGHTNGLEPIASLLKQLVQDSPLISEHVQSLHNYHQVRSTHPVLGEFMKVFQLEIGKYDKVFIVVDALDEFLERDQGCLIKELRSLTGVVNLIFTSRPLPSIEQHFQGAKRVGIQANDQDVRTYVKGRILREPRLILHVKDDQELQNSIENKIVANVQGIYVPLASMVLFFLS